MVDRWGYATMFSVLALFAVLSPVSASLVKDKATGPTVQRTELPAADSMPRLGRSFLLLVMARLMVSIASLGSILGRSLHMNNLGFAVAAISSTGAVGGAVTLPLPPIIGWLSDRLGRKRFLILGYLAAVGGLLILARSASLWHFWVAACVLSVAGVVATSVGQALVTDLVPPAALGRGMSLFDASMWVGAIIGFAAAGNVAEAFGVTSAFLAGAVLSLIATGLIILIRQPAPDARSSTAPAGADPPDAG